MKKNMSLFRAAGLGFAFTASSLAIAAAISGQAHAQAACAFTPISTGPGTITPNAAGSFSCGPNAGLGSTGTANTDNTALGASAGVTVTGHGNTATGFGSGSRVTGFNDTANGTGAGIDVSGNNNTGTGVIAGGEVKGSFNTANGVGAGFIVTGSKNTASGNLAGSNVTGDFNTASGNQAGQHVNGLGNTANGSFAGQFVTGNFNTASGSLAGQSVIGSENVALGVGAGQFLGAASNLASNNIAIGTNAGSGQAGSPLLVNNTIAIGNNAQATADNAIAIGSGVVATGASQVSIGNSSNTYTLAGLSQTGAGVVVADSGGGLSTTRNLSLSSLSVSGVSNLNGGVNVTGLSSFNGVASFTNTAIAGQGSSQINGAVITLTNGTNAAQTITLNANADPVITVTNGTAAGTATINNGTVTAGTSVNTPTVNANTVAVSSNLIAAPGANISMGNNIVHDVAAPMVGTDAANKAYVDNVAGGVFNRLNAKTQDLGAGIAVASSLATPDRTGNQTWAVAVNWGNFEGFNAVSGSAIAAIAHDTFFAGDMISLGGSVGVSTDRNQVAGRVSLQIAGGAYAPLK